MPAPDERASVVRRVQDLLDEGFLQQPGGSSTGVRDPLPVHGPDGCVHSWMVPFVADGKLVAWVQPGRALEFLRFSLLAGGNIDASPDAVDWLDLATVAARIAKAAGTSHFLTPPRLSYDREPGRLVWAAEVREAGGSSERWLAGYRCRRNDGRPTAWQLNPWRAGQQHAVIHCQRFSLVPGDGFAVSLGDA